ncbi:MAG: fumarylacetoacetate hydrolase family protein, partial [Actinomycetota bacterium]|nr:fumarylacetoacetate hydrolase family protein [Actinomycetota bacterium]
MRFTDPAGETRLGVLEGETVRDAGAAGPRGLIPSAQTWATLAQARGPQHDLDEIALLHPGVPEKILAIGLNYRSHAAESALDVPAVPVVFAKWSSSLIGPGQPIVIPREETRPDYEGELAVIIGQTTYRATPETARSAIGGICALHDVSGRRAQLETPLRQFTLGKSFDTFTPMGPCVASVDDIDLGDI